MPWKECNRMDERLRFVAKLLDGEKMAVACREFGISRKTGYKIFARYKEFGVYNNDRPHQGLEGLYPGELYTPSAREFFQPGEPEYPLHDRTIKITRCGRICIGNRKINLSTV